jgi:hypothetical protein
MKKIFMLLAILIVMPLAFAIQEAELKAMETNTGAEVRFIQLERSIHFNEIRAERVVEFIAQKEEVDTEVLSSLVLELSVLRSEISNLDLSVLSRQEIAKVYVDYRQAANSISKEFREEASNYLTGSERSELASSSSVMQDRERLQEYNQMIALKIREHNAKRFEERATEFVNSEVRQEAVQRIRQGELNAAEARRLLAQQLQERSEEERRRVILEREQEANERSVERERILRERTESSDRLVRERTTERVEEIRSEPQRPTTSIYRVISNVGESLNVENQRFILQRLTQDQASINYAGEEFVLRIGERQNLRHATVMYYAFRTEREAIFVISPNLNAAEPTRTDTRVVEEDRDAQNKLREQERINQRTAEEERLKAQERLSEEQTRTQTTTNTGDRR